MAIGGFSKSRNVQASHRVGQRHAVRRALLETLESRQLLAVGPQLIGIQPDSGDLLRDGDVLQVSPRELVLRFSDNGGIDPASLGAIRVIRSGEDGVFERASIATDLGSNGQTLVEFFAREVGQAGNGLELRFSAAVRNDTRAPVVRVTGRVIDIELNVNPNLETRVEDILRALDPATTTPATNLVYALRLRGSQTIAVGRTVDTTRPLVLSGANSAKGSSTFGLGNNFEVRFVARDTGSAGAGVTINVAATDPGVARPPVISVNGKVISVLLNSNPRFATTAREFVDAFNASSAFQLVEAQLVSGAGATRIGSSSTNYTPVTLSGVSDIEVVPGYVGLGDTNREVVLRFAEALPDDQYRIEILGQGLRTLTNVAGEVFNAGVSRSIGFELDLGAKIVSVVPQPVTRSASGAYTWSRTTDIDLYFNDDKLIDVSKVISVNGVSVAQLTTQRGGVLFFQNSDAIVFNDGSTATVLSPQFYQLINSNGTLTTADDAAVVNPSLVQYYPDGNRVALRFARALDQYATGATGELRLRVGTNETRPLAPVEIDALATDPGDTFAGAMNLAPIWMPGAGTSQSVIVTSEIENTSPFQLDFPGGSDEPGNRQIRMQDNLRLGADNVDGISTFRYNFQGQLQSQFGTFLNAITEQQKLRVREVFSLYERYLGVKFVESASQGMTIAVGDLRAVIPFPDIPGGTTPGATEPNGPGFTAFEAGTLTNGQLATVLDSQDFSSSLVNDFGGSFTRAAMQAVGRLLGLGDADELEQLTIQSFASVFAPGVGTEMVFPGDGDIVHGQFLYRPESKDIDLYQFSLPVAGRMTIETFAERMSQASLLDTHVRLYQQTAAGWEEIAANNDYFSSDSYLELDLAAGNYIVGVSASGNSNYDPIIPDSGLGGLSEGSYQLRMDFTPPAPSVMRDADSATGTPIDGDADGRPGGVFDFWFRPSTEATTRFVNKASVSPVTNGAIDTPYKTISAAIAAAQPGDVVRVLGNGGADGNFATQADNLAYEIGFNSIGSPLDDGATLDVPKDVTLMIDAGAILKLRRARIGVGSSSVSVDRSGGALMVLGTPTLISSEGRVLTDAAGNAISGNVYMTSLNDIGLGRTSTNVVGVTAGAGDWGGLDFRNRIDTANNRNRLEGQGIFVNYVSHADIRFGGGQVVVDGTSQVITPVQMIDARPTIVYNSVTRSADAAMSATPDSFLESNFHSPAEQGTGAVFTVDYDRVGPEIHGNRLLNNSINGLQVRVSTRPGTQLEKLTAQGRFDDTDIVHYVPENLEIQGTPGGAIETTVGGVTRVNNRLDARLVIDPGTVIKSQGSRIDVAFGSQLIAEGLDGSPIVFTSVDDIRYGAGGTFDTANRAGQPNSAPGLGDWGGIYVGHTSSASLDHVVIAYGGGTTRIQGGFADFSALEVHQADVRLTRSRLELNANGSSTATSVDRGGRGMNTEGTIFVRGAQPVIVDNIIRDNAAVAMTFNVSSLNSNFVSDGGRSRGMLEVLNDDFTNQGPLVRGNRMQGNSINGLEIRPGTLTTEGVWDDTDIVHVVNGEVVVPDFHAFGGLRLESSATESIVVKFLSSTGGLAGLTATGTRLDNANRIGGSVKLVGQPGLPVVLTSLNDNTVGAGFTLAGAAQLETIPVERGGLLPTGPEVNNGTLIDNDVAPGIPGQFAFDVGVAGNANFGGRGGISAQGNTQLFVNEDVIFDFTNYIDIGGNGNGIDLSTTNITLQPTLIANDLVASEGNFTGPNGLVSWRVESRMDNGIAKLFNTIILTSTTPLGNLQFINYLDEDVRGVSDDILYVTGTPGEEDFRAFTLDGPERVGFSQGGIYTPTPNLLENATYEGWAADRFANLLVDIGGAGTTYTVPGNINEANLPPFIDPELGQVYGPADVTTAFAWRVNPLATSARITSFLELVPRNPATPASSGDWRSVLFDSNSNDRNVAAITESESARNANVNNTPNTAQYLGGLAPNENSGDENRRLGFEIQGAINAPADVDVYSFEAQAGTEVWLDIDRTSHALDTIVELIDADGRMLALSDNSLDEEANPSLLQRAPEISAESVNPLRLSTPELYFQSASGAPKDLYSTNPRDAGMRVSLPGAAGTTNLYHVRVRSDGLTRGTYQLQIRLTEVDEVPGSSIHYADIRFAQSGVQLVGVPQNSPLLGENSETAAANGTFANAQQLGNLLQTNRQALSVAGNLDSPADVDWFRFTIDYQRIRPTSIREYFATVFDVDYADGLGRPDISFYVFNAAGNLILASEGSNLVDDQASPLGGAGNADLSRGSAGTLDSYIDSFEMPSGEYFVAVTNSSQIPQVLRQFTDANATNPLVRLQPIEGVQLIAEEHVDFNGGSTFLPPIVPDLFTADAEVPWTLSDIVLYVSRDAGAATNLYAVNPFTGQVAIRFDNQQPLDVEDIAFRSNGQLRAFDRAVIPPLAGDLDAQIDYIDIDTGTGTFTVIGTSGLETFHRGQDAATPPNAVLAPSNDGVNPEAITFAFLQGQERGFFVGSRPTPAGVTPDYFGPPLALPNVGTGRPGVNFFSNVLYEFDENTGRALGNTRTDLQQFNGAWTDVVERAYIETRNTSGAPPTRLVAPEVTTTSAGALQRLILDGSTFTLFNPAGPPFNLVFEFDLGPEALVNYDPVSGLGITDGMVFTVEGVDYEFDTGSVVVFNATNGGQLADGATLTLRNTAGVERVFEFDSNGALSDANHLRVPFAAGNTQAQLIQSLIATVNLSPLGIRAENVPGTNRVSFVGASATVPVVVAGAGMSVVGTVGVAAGNERIAISEAATTSQMVAAISAAMPNAIEVSFDSGRINFSGATTADFGDLETAGIFVDQLSGGASPFNTVVRVLANDTAETVASRIAAAVNDLGIAGISANSNGDTVQLFGAAVTNPGSLQAAGVAPGGIVTGIAVIGDTLFAVSDEGGLYRVNNPQLAQGTVNGYVATSSDLLGIEFSGLVAGPAQTSLTGTTEQLLFGISRQGTIFAFNTRGELQPVFANGATSIRTNLFGANGLAMSTLQTNLWTTTNLGDNTNRESNPGHGLPATPNNSRGTQEGGSSYYFGNSTAVNYNFPGGAAGALESVPFSLAGLSAADLPMLYFNYFSATENVNGVNPRDAFRVYASGEDGNWILLATNNSGGEIAVSNQVQELFDQSPGVTTGWRQARVPLDRLAGQENIKLRFEFSTGAGFGYGREGGSGPEIRTLAGNRLADGQSLSINGQLFEIEMGPTLSLPGGRSLTSGDSLSIDGVRYIFTDGTGSPVVAPDVAVPFTAMDTPEQVAESLRAAVAAAAAVIPVRAGFVFSETNDVIGKANQTGTAGGSVRIIGTGEIGDRLADANEDVDMVRIDVGQGANVTVRASASAVGSALDSYLRVFDNEGRQISAAASAGAGDSQLTLTGLDEGTYFIGVSGSGNQVYSAVVPGLTSVGSTGAYQLEIQIENPITPIVSSNLVQLQGASLVTLGDGSPLRLQGAAGTLGTPVRIGLNMTTAQVTAALRAAIADHFADGRTAVYPTRGGDTINLTGLTVDDRGPFGLTTSFQGDGFTTFNEPARAQNNNFEGVYVDDFIIGIAGRGEMVVGVPGGNTTFVSNPDAPDEILTGPYQFEIRGGQEYGRPTAGGIELEDSFAINERTGKGLSIRFLGASQLVAGATFTVGDGPRIVTFELDDVNDMLEVAPGNVALTFNAAVVNPMTGGISAESANVIAARFRDLLNSEAIQAQIRVAGNLLNNDRFGATSDTVVLIGNATAEVPSTVGEKLVSTRDDGENRKRPQGQVVINALRVSDSAEFGISVAAAPRDAVTGAPVTGVPRNTITLNTETLAPGAVIMNSQLIANGGGGINVTGDSQLQANGVLWNGTRSFVRLVNNTIVGGSVVEGTNSTIFTPSGTGINVSGNATATLLNNVIVNSTVGVSVDATSSSTVIGGTVFHRNLANVGGVATTGQFPAVLDNSAVLFQDIAARNLYPAANSPIIDSSIDSLEDRPSLVAVKGPLGLAPSPLLAPSLDINGQLRVDDPNVETPSGLGERVFKDRGAHDRADFAGPTVLLLNPLDNDFDGVDRNPTDNLVELSGGTLRYFDISVVDGIEPSDPGRGVGVDDATVTSASVQVFGPKRDANGIRRQNQPLVEGIDYTFGYDSTNGIIRLTPLAGIWESEAVYTVRFLTQNAGAFELSPTGLDGDQFSVVDVRGITTTFELEYGYLVQVPDLTGIDLATLDGLTFTVDDGNRRLRFEMDRDGSVLAGNRIVDIRNATTAAAVGRIIESSIEAALLNLTINEVGAGRLQIQGSRLIQFLPETSGLSVTGRTGVQTAFGLQIPLQAGAPSGLDDGQTFSIARAGGTPVTFEIDTNGTIQPNSIPVRFAPGATAAQIGAALVTAINVAALGLTPAYVGEGLVTLGGDASTVLDLGTSSLTQSGVAGQEGAIPITLAAGVDLDLAAILKSAIDGRRLPGVVVTQFGDRLLVDGAVSVGGVGSREVGAIRDLAGNPLKANQLDGTNTLTIFLGEGLDYGDAPAPYISSAADGGPAHRVVPGLSLGATVTVDADARLDDADQDDGFTILGAIFAGFQATVQIPVTNTTGRTAYMSIWVDFNNDGVFSATENRMLGQEVTSPLTTFSFAVPSSAMVADTFVRIRLSTDRSSILSPTIAPGQGPAPDGEVEDHAVHIYSNPYHNVANPLDVNGDTFVSPIDILQVINWFNDPARPRMLSLAGATGLPPFVDVNNDQMVTALDILQIINYLNARTTNTGEGEGSGDFVGLSQELFATETTVLASDWAAGLEMALTKRPAATEPMRDEQINDWALLAANDDSAGWVIGAATAEVDSSDTFWLELAQGGSAAEEALSADELNEALWDDLLS